MMMVNFTKILFLSILMIGTLITVSSNSWFGVWAGLEINLLSFIPMMSSNNLMSSEASLKYYLVQSLASIVLLFSVIMYMFMEVSLYTNSSILLFLILSSLFMKVGSAPFHFWLPSVMEGLTWMNGLLLLTWQKVAPLVLISYFSFNWFLNLSIIFSTIVGSLGGFNQTSLRKLMAFSSINHLGWMLVALMLNETVWLIYFFLYCFMSMVVLLFFYSLNMFHINQLFNTIHYSSELKVLFVLSLLSLGGLPPFIGFFPKWMVISSLVNNFYILTVFILVITALLTLFFYLRLGYSALMLNFYEPSWKYYMLNNLMLSFSLFMLYFSLFGFLLISFMYFCF